MQCEHAFVGVCLERENTKKENNRWENKNGNKTHWQRPSSSHTSWTLSSFIVLLNTRVIFCPYSRS